MQIDQSELPRLRDEFEGIPKVLFVGGWARDWFRKNVTPTDVDIMVVGVSEDELLRRGFQPVNSANNDTFGVFFDTLGREVAMAREEVSTGEGHRSFDVEPIDADVDPREAIERDLRRRDFTVNAIAFDREGFLWDPHHGVRDLDAGLIRAVDDNAFVHDPLRILRGARFAARLDADIASDTLALMQSMTDALTTLPQERVRMEMEKALVQAGEPSQFFDILNIVGALDVTFPELNALRGVPAGPPEFHEEGTAFRHTMMVLDEMVALRSNDELAALMAIAHDIGKGTTPEAMLPSHHQHGKRGLDVIEAMAERLSMSNEQEKVMKDAARWHMPVADIEDLRESTVINLLNEVRDPSRLVSLAAADALGRRPQGDFNQADAFRRFANASQAISEWHGGRLIEEGYDPDEMGGEQFGNLLHQKRVERMRELE